MTSVGYLPIIQEPAHEMDTLNTVVQRCMYISDQLGQHYTVLTADQALYYKLMDLKWSVPAYKDRLIPRMGGLHIAMNFQKVIGLAEIWVESGILGPNSTERAMAGKDYNRAMRAHQALRQILMPQLLSFTLEKEPDLHATIKHLTDSREDIDELISALQDDR